MDFHFHLMLIISFRGRVHDRQLNVQQPKVSDIKYHNRLV